MKSLLRPSISFADCTFNKDNHAVRSLMLAYIVKLFFTLVIWWLQSSLTNSITRYCGNIQVCLSAQNGNSQEISCCMHTPTECRWKSVSNPQANVTQRQEISGLVLNWQPGRDPYGQYNCINRNNGTDKEVIFLPENQQDSCPSCMSIGACITSSEIKLVITVQFSESLISTQCELTKNNGLPHGIQLDTCISEEFSTNVNYSITCPICDNSQYSIFYNIPRSILADAVDCSIAGTCITPSPTAVSSSTDSSQSVNRTMSSTDAIATDSSLSSGTLTSPSNMPTQNGTSDESSKIGIIAGSTVGAIVAIIAAITILIVIIRYFCPKEDHKDPEIDEIPNASAANCDTTDGEPPLNTEQETSSTTQSIPTDDAPTDNAPTDNAPTDNAPTDNVPTDNAPTDNGPTDNGPTDNAPTDNVPTDNIPTDNGPTDNIPTDNGPTGSITCNHASSQNSRQPVMSPSRDSTENNSRTNLSELQSELDVLTKGDESIMKIINRLHPEMEKYIAIDELLPYLNKHQILTKLDREKLGPSSKELPTMKTQYLIFELDSKGPAAEKNFVKALYESSSHVSGHKHLVQLLQGNGVTFALSTEV